MSTSKRVLFQLSGSIACFKACAALSALVKAGYEVEVAATRGALQFVGEATLEGLTGRAVHTDVFERGSYMQHIHLIRWADVIVLAPASANTLARFSAGLGDDLVSTLFLAHDFKKPYLVAPAMNQMMYAHPATAASLEKLRSWGITVLETGTGALACGEVGEGRMLEADEIVSAIEAAVAKSDRAHQTGPTGDADTVTNAKSILITSGGTSEPIDGVRAITNTSTGRTGAELAWELKRQGHRITLVHAKTAILPEPNQNPNANMPIKLVPFTDFASLDQAVKHQLSSQHFDAVVHLAAVADYSVKQIETAGTVLEAPVSGKIDSSLEMKITLTRNEKIVDHLRDYSKNKAIKVVAFKLTNTEDSNVVGEAIAKLNEHARPDIVVHNDLHEITPHIHPFTIYQNHQTKKANGARELADVLGANL